MMIEADNWRAPFSSEYPRRGAGGGFPLSEVGAWGQQELVFLSCALKIWEALGEDVAFFQTPKQCLFSFLVYFPHCVCVLEKLC